MSDHYDRYNGMEKLLGTDLATKRTVKGFPIDADLLMLKAEEEYGIRARDRLYELIRTMPKYELPPVQPKRGKWIDRGWTGDWQYLTDGRGNCWRNIICSECGESVRHESNFCPNCGAKMEVME